MGQQVAWRKELQDGEGGPARDEATAQLKQLATTVKTRAPCQHARYIEVRNGILRNTMHVLESDLDFV